jgi:acyl transferase domain-containing protein
VTPEELEGAAHVVAIGPPGGRGDAWEVLCDGLAALHVEGHPIDWEAFARGLERRRVGLPTYPFERRRYWIHDAIPGGAPEDGVTPQPPAAEAERGSPPGPDAPPPAAAPSAPADLPAPPGGDIEVILAEQLQMLSHVLEEQLRLLEQTAHG